ncbi:DNA-3-methyladenine glycosylase [Streptomyces sp. SM10]|uniref:DNA-3-methyladenine glycosylase n=1 Tax=Streptomyces sp. SM10 TaxID=565556 RepID=UPI000CD4A76A|nr:DNA-3-methyladenine glycosylase [Streptomyces sp. SM10]
MDRTPVTRNSFDRPILQVAPDLLGRALARTSDVGPAEVRRPEAEAYAGEAGLGSHACRGRTTRTSVMFGPAGHSHIHFTHGTPRRSA